MKKVFENVVSFEVDRSKWLRGEGSDNSYLLRSSDQKMCCLGFYAQACGFVNENIKNARTPVDILQIMFDANSSSIIWNTPLIRKFLDGEHMAIPFTDSDICDVLMRTNDSKVIFNSERETQLKSVFATIGVDVIFK